MIAAGLPQLEQLRECFEAHGFNTTRLVAHQFKNMSHKMIGSFDEQYSKCRYPGGCQRIEHQKPTNE